MGDSSRIREDCFVKFIGGGRWRGGERREEEERREEREEKRREEEGRGVKRSEEE